MLHIVQIGLFHKSGAPVWVEINVGFYCQDDISPDWVCDRIVDQLVADGGQAFAEVVVMFHDASETLSGLVNVRRSVEAIEAWLAATPGVWTL